MKNKIEKYQAIKSKYKNTITFFRNCSYYELLFDDAKIASQILGLTLTSIEYENKIIPLAVFIYHSLDKYLSGLINAGYRVAICEQLEGHPVEVEVATPELKKVNKTEIGVAV